MPVIRALQETLVPVEQSQVRRWEVRWYGVAQSRLQVIVRRWANVVCAFRRRDVLRLFPILERFPGRCGLLDRLGNGRCDF